jgi:hypothetical protein
MTTETCDSTIECGGRTLTCKLPPHEHGNHKSDWDGCPCTWPRKIGDFVAKAKD